MRRAASQPLLRQSHQDEEDEEEQHPRSKSKPLRDVAPITRQLSCINLHKKSLEEYFSCEKSGAWRQEQRSGAAKLKKQLKARWTILKLVDEQLGRFRAHYRRAMSPIKMSNVAHLLMPKWAAPHELAAVFWLGDWRPSSILELLRSFDVWDPVGVERALSHLINDIRNEEAVIDEEMTEVQANCVLHLPFGRVRDEQNGPGLFRVASEFRKIHRVILKAENLRMKALELAIKKVLSQSDAAEFLVAFVGIQDVIHEVSSKIKARNTVSANSSSSIMP